MDEYMLRELMRRGGMGNERTDDVSRRFKEFMMREDNNSRKHMMDYDDFSDRERYSDFPRGRRMRREMGESEFYEMLNRERSVNFPELRRMFEEMSPEDKRRMWKYMTTMHEHYGGKHYNNTYAKETVAEMFHTENNHKHMGERYKMEKAEEVFRKYKELLPEDVTVADVYVAINATYHRFTLLFKSWFGDNVDTKIIEAAIVFWFKDEECPEGEKIWEFYQEK